MSERSITRWATEQLVGQLDGLELCGGVRVQWQPGGWVSGEVTVGERKGKLYPIYSLEMEAPWACEGCAGKLHLPDLSLEMLDDLEVTAWRTLCRRRTPCTACVCCAHAVSMRPARRAGGRACDPGHPLRRCRGAARVVGDSAP